MRELGCVWHVDAQAGQFRGPTRSIRDLHELDILLAFALCGKFPRDAETEVGAAAHMALLKVYTLLVIGILRSVALT